MIIFAICAYAIANIDSTSLYQSHSIKPSDPQYYRDLDRAILQNKPSAIQSLFKKHIDLNRRDKIGRTPLFAAVQLSRLVIVREMVSSGAKVNVTDKEGNTPLTIAGDNLGESDELVMYLLDHGADPTYQKPVSGNSLMYKAISDFPTTRLVEKLLAKGVKADGFDVIAEEVSEVTTAIPSGLTENQRFEFMIKHSGNPKRVLTTGDPYLFIAVKRGNYAAAKLLLKHGANPNKPALGGTLPIFEAVSKGPSILELLIEHGADANAKNDRGQSILNYVIAASKARNHRKLAPEAVKQINYLRLHGAKP